jgi:hypothetical protein
LRERGGASAEGPIGSLIQRPPANTREVSFNHLSAIPSRHSSPTKIPPRAGMPEIDAELGRCWTRAASLSRLY